MEHTSNDTKKIIGALLIGTAVGAAIGILFAPAKGADTRKKISEKSEDFTNVLKDKFNEFLEEVKSEYEAVKEKAEKHFSENESRSKEEMKVK